MLIRTVVATCVVAAFSWAAAPSMAATTVWVRQAPPELRVEQAPQARRGSQWVPGYWDWRGNRHVWHTGTWVRARPGYVYASPNWVERDGRWNLRRGQWSRNDRDGDGVRNNRDRRPDDPTRR